MDIQFLEASLLLLGLLIIAFAVNHRQKKERPFHLEIEGNHDTSTISERGMLYPAKDAVRKLQL